MNYYAFSAFVVGIAGDQQQEKIKESSYTYTDLARNLVQLCVSSYPIQSASVFFFDVAKTEYYLVFQRGLKNTLASDLRYNRSALALSPKDPLIQSLESTQDVVNMETILNESDNALFQPLLESLNQREAELVFPFIFGDKLRGFLIVGPKKDSTLFNEAEKANVLYKVNFEPAKTLLQGNEEDLIRLVDNLIANALRYVPETGGRIELMGRNKEQGYEIRVKDNGDGIEPENLEKIWDLGWQATGDKKKGSSGFGLSIVRQIVQVHSGTIQAFSQGKGTGTEFRLLFPILRTERVES